MKQHILVLACLAGGTSAYADAPQPPKPQARSRPQPCQGQTPDRSVWPNGTLLWGNARKVATDETSTQLASVDLASAKLGATTIKGLRLQDGHLEVPKRASKELVGAVLQGAASDGQPVEVALCGAEPAAQDPAMEWYRIEIWNAQAESWANPCLATTEVPAPRALAVRGVWDGKGAHLTVADRFTFACENGAIAKCITWGYKPWAKKDGRSLEELHQACTRMVRADYCGDGHTHTRENSPIDVYDGLGVLARTTEPSKSWDPKQASFEAAWGPEGARCLSRARDGQAVEMILSQCPERFEAVKTDLGEGDRCSVRRKGAPTEGALLRNHSYGR
ncbi:ADYC domain-containing protein [Hyalangium versicolor]|uniref:ADYC domain-containing protein n=1 Tax=Hyalangium versicolor TaxID=2861190 RepID=UPI001CCCDA63|nr:ADYC domain-containing protein [Hyalangium versicolor]